MDQHSHLGMPDASGSALSPEYTAMLADLSNNRRDIISTQVDPRDEAAPLSQRDKRILENSRLALHYGTAEYELARANPEGREAWKSFKADLDADAALLPNEDDGQSHRRRLLQPVGPSRHFHHQQSNMPRITGLQHHVHHQQPEVSRFPQPQPSRTHAPPTPSAERAAKRPMVSFSRSFPTAKTGGGIIAAHSIMANMGWVEGQGLGPDGAGTKRALSPVRRHGKAGFGYVPPPLPVPAAAKPPAPPPKPVAILPPKKKKKKRTKGLKMTNPSCSSRADLFSRETPPTLLASQAIVPQQTHPRSASSTTYNAMPPPPTTKTFAPMLPKSVSFHPNADMAAALELQRSFSAPKEPYGKKMRSGGPARDLARQPQPTTDRQAAIAAPKPTAPVMPRHPPRAPIALAEPKDWFKSRDDKFGVSASKWASGHENAAPSTNGDFSGNRKDSVTDFAEKLRGHPSTSGKKPLRTVQTNVPPTTVTESKATSSSSQQPSSSMKVSPGEVPTIAASSSKELPQIVHTTVTPSAPMKQNIEVVTTDSRSEQLISLEPDTNLAAGMQKLRIRCELEDLKMWSGSGQGLGASKWAS